MLLVKAVGRSKILLLLILLQAFAAAYILGVELAAEFYGPGQYDITYWLLALIGLLSLLAITQVRKLIEIAEIEAEAQLTSIQLTENIEMITTLRSQRHDFLNHLQAVTGFIQLGKPEKALEYVDEVVKDICDEKGSEYTGELEFQALLSKMTAAAGEKGIRVEYQLMKAEDIKIPVPPTKMARIVGNLLRNAIEAVEHLSPEQRWVQFSVVRLQNSWQMSVHNPGPSIAECNHAKIFESGFSTKATSGRGLGLSIVAKITKECGGEIYMQSRPELGTIFTVNIPLGQ